MIQRTTIMSNGKIRFSTMHMTYIGGPRFSSLSIRLTASFVEILGGNTWVLSYAKKWSKQLKLEIQSLSKDIIYIFYRILYYLMNNIWSYQIRILSYTRAVCRSKRQPGYKSPNHMHMNSVRPIIPSLNTHYVAPIPHALVTTTHTSFYDQAWYLRLRIHTPCNT